MLLIVLLGLALLAIVYWALAYILLYHLTRFGVGTLPKRIAAVFLFGSFILISVMMIALSNLDLNSIISSIKT